MSISKQELLGELFWFVEPIYEAAHDQDKLSTFFNQFGYDINSAHINIIMDGFIGLTNSFSTIVNGLDSEEDIDPADLIDIFRAVKLLGGSSTIRTYFNEDFFSEVFDYLIVRYLSDKKLFLHSVLYCLGVIEHRLVDTSYRGVAYTQTKLNWSRLGDFITDNKKWAKEVYGWNGNPAAGDPKSLDYQFLVNTIALLLESGGYSIVIEKELTEADLNGFITNIPLNTTLYGATLPVIQDDINDVEDDGTAIYNKEAGLKFLPYGDFNQVQNLGIAVSPYVKGAFTAEHVLGEKTKLRIVTEAEAENLAYVIIRPSGISADSSFSAVMKFIFEIKYAEDTNTPMPLISIGDSNLSVTALKAAFGGNLNGDFYISGGAEKLSATIDLGGDGVLGSFSSGGINVDVGDVLIKWQHNKGVSFEGGNNLAITLPTHIQAGPLYISALSIELNLTSPVNVIFDVSGKLELGPLQISFDAVGFKSALEERDNGLFGDYSPTFSFKPPNGLGLSINAGAVTGGGYLFFDFEKQEYAGALELTIVGFISAKAIGFITTKMPDGSKGFSLLIIITAEFNPPFQLGYGFTLIGVGGLLGLNRTVLLGSLRDGVRTGSVSNIMFPTNIIANAPRIISDLRTIFPVHEGRFLVGPMARIGWGTPTLISLSFGLVIEIPGNIAILGVVKIVLPDEAVPIVKIQVAFVGTLDFEKKLLTFDASLYESSVLGMTLEGDMAVRLAWGDQPNFLVTVGGFHPAYTPPPLALPTLRRLAINILNTSLARIRVECYQAVTSNTVQFGARAEVFLDLRVCSIEGHIAFNALFQFNPFYFIVDVSAGFSLKVLGFQLLSVRISMSLEGPTPWRAQGTGRVTILFIKVSANFDKTWGENRHTTLPEIRILPQFIEQLTKKEQWSTVLSSAKNLLVSLRKLDEAQEDILVLHPSGALVVQQKLLPLRVNIDKIGSQKAADIKQLQIASVSSNGTLLSIKEVKENFARAQYQDMSDDEKLSKPSFEKMQGGVEISMGDSAIRNGSMVRKKLAYELTVIDKEPAPLLFFSESGLLFGTFLSGNSVSKSSLSKCHRDKLQPFAEKLDIEEELFTVVFQSNNRAVSREAGFRSEMEAQTFMQEEIRRRPALKNQLHIIPEYELQES